MEDLRSQLRQMRNMGGIGALASMIPGLAKAKAAMANNGPDDRLLLRMEAMVGSMTPKERAKPDILNAKRKIRIAKGSRTTVQDVNRLLKMHQEMSTAMKKLRKLGGMKALMGLMGKRSSDERGGGQGGSSRGRSGWARRIKKKK